MNLRPQRLVANGWDAFATNPFGSRNAASAARIGKFETVGTYRLYCLDGVGKVASAEWIEADDDQSALQTAEGMRAGRSCELWQSDRLVARLVAKMDPGRPS